jgi:AraC family transcriptional regulator
MDKIGITPPPKLLSPQVSEARYFFLNLAPARAEKVAVALGGCETVNPDYVMDRRHLAYLGLEYVAEGTGSVTLDGVKHPLKPGTLFAYSRDTHCEIRTDPRKPLVKYFVCFAGTDAIKKLAVAGLAPGKVRVVQTHSEIRSVFEDIILEGQHPTPLSREIGATLFQLLVLKIKSAAGRGPKRSERESARESFMRCKALIDANAEKLATLQEVATAAGVEASNVCRLFRRYQGTSPYQYLLRRKMSLAAAHLVEQGGLVKEAALRVGFSDPYHFSRCLKSVHGVAPRALLRYRRAG